MGITEYTNQEAEEAVIGSVLIGGRETYKQVEYLSIDDFANPENMSVWQAIKSLALTCSALDQITIAGEIDRHKTWFKISPSHLSSCVQQVPTHLDAPDFARIVKECSIHRRAVSLAHEADYEGLAKLFKEQPTTSRVITTTDMANDILELPNLETYTPVMYGWDCLDDMTTGMHPSELIIVGARPSVGKSELMLQTWYHALQCEHSALFVSAEMSRMMIEERLLAISGGLSVRKLRTHSVQDSDIGKIADVSGSLSVLNGYLMDTDISIRDISAVARKLINNKLDIIFVDYIQHLKDCYDNKKGDNLIQKVGYVSYALKDLAKELNIPIVAASQLSRNVEGRENKRPILSDLRESGNLEQDADVVLLLHRPEKYSLRDENGRSTKGILEIAHAKNRQIDSGQVAELYYSTELRRYLDPNKKY